MLSPNGIQAIFFDLDDTLRYSRPAEIDTLLDYACQLGIVETPGKRQEARRWKLYYWAMSPELVQDLKQFGGYTPAFWVHYLDRQLVAFGCSPEQASELAPAVHERMGGDYRPEDCVMNGAHETLSQLKDAGFRLAMLSNRDHPCDDQLERLGLLQYFDFTLVAGEIGSWKPDRRIFNHAIQRLEIYPEQALYVGDNYFADVIGAQNADLQPVLIDPKKIFPDAACTVITKLSELLTLLQSGDLSRRQHAPDAISQ